MPRYVLPIALSCAALSMALLKPTTVPAQTYPSRPITIVVPFPPAGATDPMARIIQDELRRNLGQPIVIENRPGSAGNIGATSVARAPADGYTLMIVANATLTMNPHLYRAMPFDPLAAFSPIAGLAEQQLSVAVHPSLPIRSIPEFIDYAKKNPGKLSVGVPGVGSPHYILARRLEKMARLELIYVPYSGGAPAVADLVAGHITCTFSTLPAILPFAETGKARIIALAESERFRDMPDLPTIAETVPGIPGLEGATAWTAFLGPPGLPRPIVDRLNEAAAVALKAPDVQAKLKALGFTPGWTTPDRLRQRMERELAAWGAMIGEIGLEPQ
jgi:tripartite-type tricarboxylate transporter receptor subunit TctC